VVTQLVGFSAAVSACGYGALAANPSGAATQLPAAACRLLHQSACCY